MFMKIHPLSSIVNYVFETKRLIYSRKMLTEREDGERHRHVVKVGSQESE